VAGLCCFVHSSINHLIKGRGKNATGGQILEKDTPYQQQSHGRTSGFKPILASHTTGGIATDNWQDNLHKIFLMLD